MTTKLSPKTIEWALEHFARYSDTDIFHKPFEYQAIYHSKDDFVKWMSGQDIYTWSTRPHRRCLVPKHRYGFRLATQLDPFDMIFYFALILEAGEKIENARLKPEKKISFSYRFLLDDTAFTIFDHKTNYAEFQRRCSELAEKHSYVVIADIADFYPRIYLHPLENALAKALPSLTGHCKALVNLIKGWNQRVSYGIPVGNNPSRLLAEIAIDNVDRILLAEDMVFTRFVDDYRIFCASRQEAYSCLTKLANCLYDSHGLTLQSQKTKILTADKFISEMLETEERKELNGLIGSFDNIVTQLGLNNPYEPIDYDNLPDSIQAQINGLNLETLLDEQLEKEEIDIPMTKFLINRLGQLRIVEPLDKIINDIDNFYPVLTEVVRYLAEIGEGLTPEKRVKVGKSILEKLQSSVAGNLEFNRMLIMSLFAGSAKWGNAESLARYYKLESDAFFRRTLILALGRGGQDYWLQTRKRDVDQFSNWDKRAFIYAASSLPKDERTSWYQAIERSRQDKLEKYVITWATQNPIN